MSVSDIFLKDILTATKTIAMVGLSMNETRPSYFVGRYLHTRGYKIIPVNAGHGGKHFFGQLMNPWIWSIFLENQRQFQKL
jgi:predicted CoA-binding protein